MFPRIWSWLISLEPKNRGHVSPYVSPTSLGEEGLDSLKLALSKPEQVGQHPYS